MKIDNFMFNLGIKHKTDKITHHRYDRIYPNFLNHLRNDTLKLFEIGYGEGESFEMWKEYFPNGSIFCMDINKEFISDRGGVYKGDQSNLDDLQKMINLIGECDVIIDDGSHIAQHQFDTFNFLFEKMLGNGGVYIIEDIECTYWDSDSEIYGYKTGELNILDKFTSVPSKINSKFSRIKNNQNISSITYSKNCIIIIKKTLEEINENDNHYRFEYLL
jgi:hypothetical protein